MSVGVPKTTRIGVLGLWALYPVAFYLLAPHAQEATASLNILFLVVSAWIFGRRTGLLFGLVSSLMTFILLSVLLPNTFSPTQHLIAILCVTAIGLLVGHASDVRKRLKAENQEISLAADRDALTGLLNRAALHRELDNKLEQAKTLESCLGILFIDLDRFKVVNDTLGHAVGDALLKTVANHLSAQTKGKDLVARLGGDEFIIILEDIHTAEDAFNLAHTLLEAMGKPQVINGHSLSIEASIGLSCYPNDGDTAEDLINHADNAMYQVKWQGKNGVSAFGQRSPYDDTRPELTEAFRQALDHGEFDLHYQPAVELAKDTVVALEVQATWHHPELGSMSQADLLSLAQDLGLHRTLTLWVIEAACRALRDAQTLNLHVNLYPGLITDAFAGDVLTILGAVPFSTNRLILGLSESDMPPHSSGGVALLCDSGVALSIEAFGEQGFPLVALYQHPSTQLSLSPAFLGNEASTVTSIDAVVNLGERVGKSVVAAGVNTAEHYALIQSTRCRYARGDYFLHQNSYATAAAPALEQNSALVS